MNELFTYFVRRQGRVEGPWPLAKLQSEVELRKLGRFHEVSLDGKKWQRADELATLFPKSEKRKVVGGGDIVSAEAADEPEADRIWYCVIGDDQQGPMTLSDLQALISNGRLPLDELVWREGLADWLPAEQVPELTEARGHERTDHTMAHTTRMVKSPVKPSNGQLPLICAVLGGLAFVLSCLPGVGLLGVIPATMSGILIRDIKKRSKPGMQYAVSGLVLGILAFLFGSISLVLAVIFGMRFWLEWW